MIAGLGVDIVEVQRMRGAVERRGRPLLERIFTEGEISYCYSAKDPFPPLSVRFAAKEAFIKAFGPGPGVRFRDIEVVSGRSGKPGLRLLGALAGLMSERNISATHLSLSHERKYSIACVVLETRET